MTWLNWLLGIETPPETTIDSMEFGIRGGFPLWSCILLGLILLVCTVVVYFREYGRVGVFRRLVLIGLRTSIFFFLIWLVLRPFLLVEFRGLRDRSVILLLDNTQSMQQKDRRVSDMDKRRVAVAFGLTESLDSSVLEKKLNADGLESPSRLDMLKAVLGNDNVDLIRRIQSKGPIQPMLFGESLKEIPLDDVPQNEIVNRIVARITGQENATKLADLLMELASKSEDELPAAIVLATDGRDTASIHSTAEAAMECQRRGIPLLIYGVGSDTGAMLQLLNLTVPKTIFVDDALTIPVRWRANGFKNEKLQLTVSLDGKVVGSKQISAKNGPDLRDEVTINLGKDLLDGGSRRGEMSVALEVVNGPANRDQISQSVQISDSKLKILFIENLPRWEYKFLQSAFLRDRRISPDFLLVEGDPRLLQSGYPFLADFPKREELLKYDLIILGDVPASYLSEDRQELLVEYVRDFRGGLIVIAGRSHLPGEYENNKLAELLPVESPPYQFRPEDNTFFRPQLTLAGESADMLQLADTPKDNQTVWENLPGLYWHFPAYKARPSATVFLTHGQKKNDGQPLPIMASHFYGKGQVLFLGTDETWRWRYNTEDKYYTRFWGQLVYHYALPHLLGDSSAQTTMTLERSEALLDRPGAIYGRFLDNQLRPRTDEEIAAKLVSLDIADKNQRTKDVVFRSIPGRPGEYRLFTENDQPGRFLIRVPGSLTSFEYRVIPPPRHELAESPLAVESLKEMSSITQDNFYREEDLIDMVNAIQPRQRSFTVRQEVLLWNPLVFLVFLGLITSEWIVRKFSNLS